MHEDEGGGGSSNFDKSHATAVLATVVGGMPPEQGAKIGGDYRNPKTGHTLLGTIAELLTRGWLAGQITHEANSGSWIGVAHPPSALLGRLERVLERAAPSNTEARRPTGWPEHCGDEECDPRTRMRMIDDGQAVTHCPKCHPKKVGDAA